MVFFIKIVFDQKKKKKKKGGNLQRLSCNRIGECIVRQEIMNV